MEQLQYNTKEVKRNYSHLTYEQRQIIAFLYNKDKLKPAAIAKKIGFSEKTIRRELKRGMVETQRTKYDPIAVVSKEPRVRYVIKEYSAEVAQEDYDFKAQNKGPSLKIGTNYALAMFIDSLIAQKISPYVISLLIKERAEEFGMTLCFKTIYNYIYKYVLKSRKEDLLEAGKRRRHKKPKRKRKSYKNTKGKSISERPQEANDRTEFGHWEGDTVVSSQSGECLLVLTERLTRYQIIRKIKNRKQSSVIKEFNKMTRELGINKFREIFKTVTVDNGVEFLDSYSLENYNGKLRCIVYYAHPYSSFERGSNERANRLIRRFIPKKSNIGKYSNKEVKFVEDYINDLPRKILGDASPRMLVQRLGIAIAI